MLVTSENGMFPMWIAPDRTKQFQSSAPTPDTILITARPIYYETLVPAIIKNLNEKEPIVTRITQIATRTL